MYFKHVWNPNTDNHPIFPETVSLIPNIPNNTILQFITILYYAIATYI